MLDTEENAYVILFISYIDFYFVTGYSNLELFLKEVKKYFSILKSLKSEKPSPPTKCQVTEQEHHYNQLRVLSYMLKMEFKNHNILRILFVGKRKNVEQK